MASIATTASEADDVRIEKGTTVRGSFQVEGDLLVEGNLEGKVFVTGRLAIGPTGVLTGEATCAGGVVRGRLSGVVHSSEPVAVDDRAAVSGRVMAPALDFGGGERPASTALDPGGGERPASTALDPGGGERPASTALGPGGGKRAGTGSRPPTVTGDRPQVVVTPDAVLGRRP
jgi:hypothetical protein